ncbi:hypothetical protein DAPPUDRAFT_233758 [Daphnia pulex]|uniref:Uncharacterized protein n=1 Tax=Daphnia pulex TaxID=6669 RepID=E9FVM7_DAPPU|nr:hypothetical protein DAPPUDRAFT_233758 [Daphnia pulex]|eukprot:EFX89077.1 hypothetical protein DAPPUDRAFT_233758 [Daphnia pulex]
MFQHVVVSYSIIPSSSPAIKSADTSVDGGPCTVSSLQLQPHLTPTASARPTIPIFPATDTL